MAVPYLLSRDAIFQSDLLGKRERPAANVAFQWQPNDDSVYTFEAMYNGYRNTTFNQLLFSFVDWWGNLVRTRRRPSPPMTAPTSCNTQRRRRLRLQQRRPDDQRHRFLRLCPERQVEYRRQAAPQWRPVLSGFHLPFGIHRHPRRPRRQPDQRQFQHGRRHAVVPFR
ncbi:MAG: hypothetical protein WDN06_08240 [Asticcacaulis sp.]